MNANFLLTRMVFILILGLPSILSAREALPDFTELVAQNAPAVVNISTTRAPKAIPGPGALPDDLEIPDLPEDSPLGELLRRFFGEEHGFGTPQPYRPHSLGSGFIISPDGYIITNNHVAKDAEEIIVRLSDRREFVAEVVGADPRTDLALLKIEAENLPVVELGSSRKLEAGEWVVAIGSPFGFEHSVTAGIVSAKGRSLPRENYVPFIQTDVAINPGNSGGPLFNLDGEVVGINSQIYSRTGGFMGLSFAIPIELAMDVVEELKATGDVQRGWLGVYIQEISRELAQSFGLDKPTGALVAKVMPDSPAQKAGIQVGDVILSFRGHDVPTAASLPPLVGRADVGEEVPLEILRNGERITEQVVIGELPPKNPQIMSEREQPAPQRNVVLGIEVTELTLQERKDREIDHGLRVTEVHEGPARQAGIRKGDILMRINNQSLDNVAQFKNLVEGLPAGKFASVLVQRGRGPEFLAIEVPPAS